MVTAQITLDDAREKLRWAKHHFEILRDQIEPFEQRDTHTIRVEVDRNAGTYTFYVSGLEPVDPDWALMIGDCLQSARSALDYVLVRLWALVTNQSPSDVRIMVFPVYDDPEKFASDVRGKLRKELAFSGYLARIEELQPFNGSNPSVWGYSQLISNSPFAPLPMALQRLSTLNNIDKHRVIHATWVGTTFGGTHTQIGKDAPSSFTSLGGSLTMNPLDENTEVGNWRFVAPLPEEWTPTEVQMKGYFPVSVAFPDPSLEKRVLEILPWCISAAEAVIEIFDPVFTQRVPPLPVTSVSTVRG